MDHSIAQPQGSWSHPAHSWVLSLLVHSVAVWMAMMALGDLNFMPKDEPFRWDVSMVEPPKPTPMAEPAPTPVKPSPVKPTPTPVQPVEPTPIVETRPTPIVQTVQPIQRVETQEMRQEVQEVRSVQQVVEQTVQTLARPAEPMATPQSAPQAITQSVAVIAETAVLSAPTTEAVVQASQPVAHAAPAPVVGAKSIETATAAAREIVEPKVLAAPPSSVPVEALPMQVASAPPAPVVPRLAVKADYRWVGDALGERVRQLLVYPAKARLNNLTGRVLVKVVIREDGHLHEIEVVKGSGHEVLDEAAIELVRRACPLKMKHSLGRPQVTITLPVVYELIG